MAKFYTVEALSENISRTPEGYLLCECVPITRTGSLTYLGSEVGIDAPTVEVITRPQDIFSELTISSFEGKPVTINHPLEFVNPTNWNTYACGTIQNVRVGLDKNADKLVCDLLITNQEAINLVESKTIREVSLGYDGEIETDGTFYYKTNIIGNHIAILAEGRCGSSCSIQDNQPSEASKMQDEKEKVALFDKIKELFTDKKPDPMAQMMDAIGAMQKQCDEMQKQIADMFPPKKEKEEMEDSAPDKELLAAIEVVAAGATDAEGALKSLEAKDGDLVKRFGDALPAREKVIACAEIIAARAQASKQISDSKPNTTDSFAREREIANNFWGKK